MQISTTTLSQYSQFGRFHSQSQGVVLVAHCYAPILVFAEFNFCIKDMSQHTDEDVSTGAQIIDTREFRKDVAVTTTRTTIITTTSITSTT